ncbi:hypothetical protein QQF64_003816 [Cirrhinus molitorella]|uniref:Uncharacterized protein n=1 Tax=Cirrhinus molitorella TaxID=172907 RepID=A0ABR3MMD6_9TELE
MSSELTQVFVEVYVNGVFYCTDSFWASDEQDMESDITGAIYNYFDSYKPENIHVQLQEVSSDEEDVQEADIKDAVLESVSLVSEDPAGPSAEEINQDGMDASPETSEENIPTEFAKVRKTISEFFRTGISPQPKTESSSEINQGGMDASPDISEEDIVIDFAKARKTISEFFRTGISQPKTDPAVSELLCKKAGSSSEIGQGGMVASLENSEEDIPIEYAKVRKTIGAFFQKCYGISAQPDPDVSELLCIPAATAAEPTPEPLSSTPEPVEPEPDLVNPEECCIPGPSSSELEPVSSDGFISDAISEQRSPTLVSEDLNDPEGASTEVGESSSRNNPSGTDASPEDIPTEKVRKINKMSKFFQKLFGISAQIQKGLAVPEPPCSPEASVPEQKPQVTELSVKNGLEEWTLSETPVTEVWPNIFLGNEETARDRTKLKEMGITHILNTAAVKKKLRVLMGRPKEKDLKGKINTGAKYYRGMNIKYCGLPTTHKEGLKMGVYFLPAAKFINKALRNPENKVLIHCCDGISHSPTLWLAYLMIHHDMNVEEAIDHVTKMRHIKPSISFLTQLMSLNAELVEQRKQQLQAAKCH